MPDMYIPYELNNPQLNMAVPPNEVRPGTYSWLSGVDGRYAGCLRKFYGMKEVVDLDGVIGLGDIDAYAGVSYFKPVTFMKRGTSTVFRGFVVRWDSQDDTDDQQIDLVYSDDDGSTWSRHAIWAAGNSITGSLAIDCAVDGEYLFVAVDTKATKTVYWAASALTTVSSGPGAFSAELAAMTENTQATSTSHYLKGDGVYRVAWRFYDSTRGIYSALSDVLTIYMDLYKTTSATGVISFDSGGGDSGRLVDEDKITINGRVYEADDDSSITGDVTVDITGNTSIADDCAALAAAINGDSSADVTAVASAASVTVTAKTAGAAANAYDFSVTEAAPNQDDLSVSNSVLEGGGKSTDNPEDQCKDTLDFVAHGSVLASYDFDDFDALFDTVQVFRSIDLGSVATTQDGSILYLEQEIAKTGNWATSGAWDSLQAVLGILLDEALVFQDAYDPEKDIVKAVPNSGTIGRYGDVTLMAEVATERGGFDIVHSSLQHTSGEYFSTYNVRTGSAEEGRPMRIIAAGDAALALHENSITHIFKPSQYKAIQFTPLHRNRGLVAKGAAHAVGNIVVMVTGTGLVMVSAADGNMGQVSAANRLFYDDWKDDFAVLESGYDAKLDASFILNPTQDEILIMWHSGKRLSLLEGANFVSAGETNAIDGTNKIRAYFITETGLIVTPDYDESGSGTMWGLSDSYTLNGTATSAGTSLICTSATFHADMVGALCYMVSGDNAGEVREIATVDVGNDTLTFTANFSNSIAVGDTYAISPVPFKARLWPLQMAQYPKFSRWVMNSISLKCRNLSSSFGDGINNNWRCGVYRNSGSSIESGTDTTVEISVDTNPADSSGAVKLDGIDIEPYIEQIASGVSFELTAVEIGVNIVDSREVTA